MLAPSVWRPDGPAAPAAARLWRGPAGALRVAPARGRAAVSHATDCYEARAAGAVAWLPTCHVSGPAQAVPPVRRMAARHSARHYLFGYLSSICTTAVAQRSCSDMSVSSARCFRRLCTVGDT